MRVPCGCPVVVVAKAGDPILNAKTCSSLVASNARERASGLRMHGQQNSC